MSVTRSERLAELERRLVSDGCIGDDEQGCTRDDDDIPLEQWCVNCLAGALTGRYDEKPLADLVLAYCRIVDSRLFNKQTQIRQADTYLAMRRSAERIGLS